MIRKHPRAVLSAVVTTVVAAGFLAVGAPADAHHNRNIDYLWIQVMGRDRDCLDAPPDTLDQNGGRVIAYPCHNAGSNGQDNQRWYVEWDAAAKGIRIMLEPSGKCLDADKNHPGPGARIQLWRCNGSDQQLWDLTPTTSVATRIGDAPVPAASRHPFRIWNRYHTDKSLIDPMVLGAGSGRTVEIQRLRITDEQFWDSYELQCMHAYHKHYNSDRDNCS
ncbi:RICIN domain-containing protein [Actinoplanes sp. NPDC049668]|uniref:RICIN domain-containing protein n=1 Tax=unclassified Actinoplanes TaxID=2626549 RepID=UPI0033B3A8F0